MEVGKVGIKKLYYNQGRAFKYCKNCEYGFKTWIFSRKWRCQVNSFYEPQSHNGTTQCNRYKRIWYKFWIRPIKSNDEWDKKQSQ